MQQFLYVGSLKKLAHGNCLLVDYQSRHAHNAVLHDSLHVGHILDINGHTHILYPSSKYPEHWLQ